MKELPTALLASLLLHLAAAGGLLWVNEQEQPKAGAPIVSASLIDAVEAHRPPAEPEVVPPEPEAQPIPEAKPAAEVPPTPVVKKPATEVKPTPEVKKPKPEAKPTAEAKPVPQSLPPEPKQTAQDDITSRASLSTAVQSTVETEPDSAAHFNPDYLHNPKPEYPALSRRLGEQGRVLLRVQVSPEGHALTVNIKESSGFERLDQASLNAVKRWQFVPAREHNTPSTFWVDVPLQFSLEK